jgi:uncharacterized protein
MSRQDPPPEPIVPRFNRRLLLEALGVVLAVTVAVTVVSSTVPDRYVAISVAFVFLATTWFVVWRKDDALVERSGLALGSLVLPGNLMAGRISRSGLTAIVWALITAAIVFIPFYFGWRWYWHPKGTFALHMKQTELLNEVVGQLVIIALPEEAFYRGYLQSRLDEALPWRIRFIGASVGPALLVTSLVFAIGHFATIRDPARLAVFFPSLLFGWLRVRTGGIGAGVLFHAMCNLFSELLGKGYRLY